MNQTKWVVFAGSVLATTMLLAGCDLNPSEPVLDGNVEQERAAGAPAMGAPAAGAMGAAPAGPEAGAEPETNSEGSEDE